MTMQHDAAIIENLVLQLGAKNGTMTEELEGVSSDLLFQPLPIAKGTPPLPRPIHLPLAATVGVWY